MISVSPQPFLTILLITLIASIFSGCSTVESGSVTIDKVNPYHLQPGEIVKTEDRMLEFEHRRHLYGAIEASERRDLMGNYFTVFWKTKSKQPATVRFEYRQGKTGALVKVKDEFVSSPKRSNVTKFQITGDDYWDNGKVTQWKVSILEGGAVVAEAKSFLWK